MNDSATQRIRELLWRRKLTHTEAAELQSLLTAHPEARADWDIESTLNQALDRLTEAPSVSTNFTALVLRAVESQENIRSHTDTRWSLHRWLPRFAVMVLTLTLALAGWHRHEVNERTAMARDVAQLGAALAASTPELTQDFESIRRLDDSSPKADTDLLALMQ
jgi:hypothetical protein